MAKKSKRRLKHKPIVAPMTEDRKIISRYEAMRMLGRSIDTLKRAERRGVLQPIKLNGPLSMTFYNLKQVEALISPARV